MSKKCGSCTKCCEGFLNGNIFGNIFGKGKPCVFLDFKNNNCSIHDIAPKDPCGNYKCMWLKYEDVPLWLKPNSSNVLVSVETYKDKDFFVLNSFSQDYSARYLSYVIRYADEKDIPLMYEISPDMFVFHNHKDFFIDMLTNSQIFYWGYFHTTHDYEKHNGFIKYLPLIVK